MSRKKIKIKNKILPDIKFNSILVSKFINIVMKNGKKSLALKIVYSLLNMIKLKINKNEIDLLEEIINKVRPMVEIKSRKIGGSTYNVPFEINDNRKNSLALKWIVKFSRKRSGNSMIEKLYDEIIDISQNKGLSIKKRDEIHKIADSNKAFSYYKWNNKK
ncbi:30S ribosomal protein S7 [Candidatus Nardonella dryophthoridicola]|uniref:Small ribosomal subunit protein uS7 n=1 Tax=endosymbiont of Rhynchophorus ferrugineus TaxID=1972133 RepID=A0A2Z5T3X2_9GAMM|nr:30S ribosomal protein S7 [Candidatus Nardonella dryophthoridicola]QTJ62844.1 30S ribosomal protein S7 [Candidatus Nardonella dryophthoridicola]BBA85088.1 30S ribosomal protein S7 [endosymbiont of Rhynchophorus ferrugineus]